MKVIHQGAEAVIKFKDGTILKEREKKTYRIYDLDDKIRKRSTRSEVKLLQKAKKIIPVPDIIDFCDKEMIIKMQYIEGKKLRDIVDDLSVKERKDIFKRVGKKVAKLHNEHIIHGDLTTSNLIVTDKIYFIDFGLGFISTKVEDKAVDLQLLKKAIHSKHYKYAKECFEAVIEGYKEEAKDFKILENRLKKVESRGRYKKKF
ncbi:MAG: KEOPS complex kinase/ATPase Bud32 [archaeon]